MRLKIKLATVLLCSVAVAALATTALARPVHHHHRHARTAVMATMVQPQMLGADRDVRYSFNARQAPEMMGSEVMVRGRGHGRRSLAMAEARAEAQSHSNSAYGGA